MSNLSLLTNSKRRHEKRTYTPLIITDPEEGSSSDALDLAARVRALMLTGAEQAQLRERLESPGELAAVEAMNNLSTAVSAAGVLAAASSLTTVSRRDLRAVANALGAIRSDAANRLTGALQDLDTLYASEIAYSHMPPDPVTEDSQPTPP